MNFAQQQWTIKINHKINTSSVVWKLSIVYEKNFVVVGIINLQNVIDNSTAW